MEAFVKAVIGFVVFLITGFLVELFWNALPFLAAIKVLTYSDGLVLFALSNILFKGGGIVPSNE